MVIAQEGQWTLQTLRGYYWITDMAKGELVFQTKDSMEAYEYFQQVTGVVL
jgi:hypothetical protein